MSGNSIEGQKTKWAKSLTDFYSGGDKESREKNFQYGYRYGNPLLSHNINWNNQFNLGNYRRILQDFTLPSFDNNSTVLEIGCLNGKWTQFMIDAKRLICVDILKEGYDIFVETHRPTSAEFYLTEGDELRGIEDESVDFMLSMDSLVRTDSDVLKKYISEIGRVMKPDGKLCIHLPCSEVPGSAAMGFTNISKNALEDYCNEYLPQSLDWKLDYETIGHGVLLRTCMIGKDDSNE